MTLLGILSRVSLLLRFAYLLSPPSLFWGSPLFSFWRSLSTVCSCPSFKRPLYPFFPDFEEPPSQGSPFVFRRNSVVVPFPPLGLLLVSPFSPPVILNFGLPGVFLENCTMVLNLPPPPDSIGEPGPNPFTFLFSRELGADRAESFVQLGMTVLSSSAPHPSTPQTHSSILSEIVFF